MAGPWDKYAAPQAPAPQTPGVIMGRPKQPDPYDVQRDQIRDAQTARDDARADAAEARAAAKDARETAAGPAGQSTESERKAASFLGRAVNAESNYLNIDADPSMRGQQQIGGRSIPGQFVADTFPNIANQFADNPRQLADQAQREFIAAVLRYDSGAAIPPEEFVTNARIYFPQPGDGPDVIRQKAQARLTAIQGLRESAGRMAPQSVATPEAAADVAQWAAGVAGATGGVPSAPSNNGSPQGPTGNFANTVNTDALGPGEKFLFDETGAPIAIQAADGAISGYSAIVDNASEREARERLEAQGDMGYATGGEAGLNRGIMLGLSDEIAGVAGGLGEMVRGGSFTEGYRDTRDVERVAQDISREEAGVLPELAGGLLIPGGALGQARNVGQFVRQGAAIGAVGGFGEGEGAVNSLLGAGGGAAVGGAIGGALSQAPRAVNALAQTPVGQRVASRFARPPQDEVRALVEAGQRQNIPIRRADADPQRMAHQRGLARNSEEGNRIIREADAEDLAAGENAVGRLSSGAAASDTFEAGERAQAVLTRQGQKTRDEASRLYKVAEDASEGARVAPRSAVMTLNDEITRLEGEGADAALISYLRKQTETLRRPEGWTPMQLHAYRSNLRKNIRAAGLPVDAAELPMIRAVEAASQDLERSLAGNARALSAVKRADKIWRERSEFRKEVGDKLFGRVRDFTPDQTGRALESMARSDSKRFARFMNEMDPEERADLSATFAAKLGRDQQGNFSMARFITQTEGKGALVTPRSMRLLFGDDGMKAIADLRAIFGAKQAAASETNYSKTGNMVSSVGRGLRSLLFSAVGAQTGGVAGAVVAPAASGWISRLGEKRAARLLTNPDFTKWLRQTPESNSPEVINRHFDRLNKIASREQAFLMDARALQEYLGRQFSEGVGRAAASGEQGQNNRGEQPR